MSGLAVAPAGGAVAPVGQQPQRQGGNNIFFTAIRMFFMWYMVTSFLKPKKAPVDPALLSRNLYQRGEALDMWVYMTEDAHFSGWKSEEGLVWTETNIPYAAKGPEGQRALEITYHPSKAAQNNATVYAHVTFVRSGYSPDPEDPTYDRGATFGITQEMTKYQPPPKIDRRKNLLGGSLTEEGAIANAAAEAAAKAKGVEEEEEEDTGPVAWISYWKPNLTLHFVDDFNNYQRGAIPEPLAPYMNFDLSSNDYFPTLVASDFWLLRDKLLPLNHTTPDLPLSMALSPLALWKWQLYLQMEQSFKIQQTTMGALESESDEIKRVFLEGNPILLGITMFVSILHSVFDFLAFKNDIQFWNQNKSMEGLSQRTIVINFFCSLVIFLYLLDNETSWMIIISAGVSVLIDFWKIGKAMHITIDRSGRIPLVRFANRESYAKSKTKEYDEIAAKYLSYALYPLVIGYAVYSLTYSTHKSWYSWLLSSLTGCVYTFGFIMMCPQLFINYKLKSVAHLPWRQMTYKFLNTIIDDLFAFVIKMPVLHRLSVFRDDIIFMILLYQRWVYPVDKKRVNEFGFGGADADVAAVQGTSTPLTLDAGQAGEGERASESAKVGVSEEGVSKRKGGGGKGGGEGSESTKSEGSSEGKKTS